MNRISFGLARTFALAISLALVMPAIASAAVWTDQADYAPGSVVTISGDNSNEAGYMAGETVHVDVAGPNGWTATCDALADDAGAWSCQVTLADGAEAVGDYTYTATGLTSGTSESGTFTDAGLHFLAVAPGPTYVAVTFFGDGTASSDVLGFPTADCTGSPDKLLPDDFTTNTDGTFKLAAGMSNIVSVLATAPSPITVGPDIYEFSFWSFSNGTVVGSATDNPVCFTAPVTTATTFVTANYVLAGDPDLTATKSSSDEGDGPLDAGESFTWTIRVENEGDADAEFAVDELLLQDDLPAGPTYSNIVVDDTNVTTGSVDCDIATNQLTCWADGGAVTLEPGDYFEVSFDVEPGLVNVGSLDNPDSAGICRADPDNVIAEDNAGGDAETNNDCADSVAVSGIVVTRGGCTFDYDTETAEETFRLIYTPDMNTSDYKLFASNPGQFFLNVFTATDGEDITIDIPYPFVTQGATPIHVYGDWTATEDNGKVCFDPGTQLWSQQDQIAYEDYGSDSFIDSETLTIDVPDDFEGFIYVRVHLAYGLNGITTDCDRSDPNAINCDPVGTIWDGQLYEFSFTDGASGSTTIESTNEFKRINGVAGLVLGAGLDPLAGQTVKIWQGSKLWKTVTTDSDGWYMALFKYTGKATTFTAKVVQLGWQQSFILKSNGFANASFIDGAPVYTYVAK
jgi:hypothetical protein